MAKVISNLDLIAEIAENSIALNIVEKPKNWKKYRQMFDFIRKKFEIRNRKYDEKKRIE